MARPEFVQIAPHSLERFRPLLGDDYGRIEAAADRARERFAGRAIWNVSSTLLGGGVAEMLRSLLPYVRDAGVDTRWVVLREQAEFFELTKRLHNNLHGDDGRRRGARRGRARALRADAGGERRAALPPAPGRRHRPPPRPPDGGPGRGGEGGRGAGRLALPHRCRPAGRDRARAPGTSSPPTSASRTTTCSRAASTSGTCSTAGAAGRWRPASTRSRRRTRRSSRRPSRGSSAAIGLGEEPPGRRPRSPAPTARRGGSSAGPRCFRRRRCPSRRRWSPRSPAGTDSRTMVDCSPASSATSAARICTSSWPARRRPPSPMTPKGAAVWQGISSAWRELGPTKRRPGPPGQPADGRPRRKRGDGQRAAAPGRRRRPEEPRRGLRPHRRRGDVEAAAGDRDPRGRDPGPDRRRCQRAS